MIQALEQTRTWFWKFEAQDLKDSELISDLVESIVIECDVDTDRRSDLELVMAEVVNNAIDHGVLGLDSTLKKDPEGFEQYFISRAANLAELREGYVQVSIDQVNDHLISISVEDSGTGFEFPKRNQSLRPESLLNAYGRGLLIIRHLCHSMIHLGRGNCILLEFKITAD